MFKLKTFLLVLCLVCLISLPAEAGNLNIAEQKEKIAVLNFSILDEQGNLLDPLSLGNAEIITLSRSMPLGVASRLVQFGNFEVYDHMYLKETIEVIPFPVDMPPFEQARILLTEYGFDQVIIGSIAPMQNLVIIGLQRYDYFRDKPRILGSAMTTAPRTTDVPAQIDPLLTKLFPPEIPVIESPIDQVYVIPSLLRINLGSSHQISAIALDSLGRPLTDPTFLYISGDESKVFVDEGGRIKGLQPGTTTVSVRGISRTARSGPPATMTVVVVPPAFGIRLGTLLTDRSGTDSFPIRMGFRFTPSFDQSLQKQDLPATPAPAAATDPTNPLAFIGSFFSSLLTSGLMTFDLDFDPNDEILFALNGIQRSSTGYIGTGVGYATPLGESETQGFVFRFTAGVQVRSMSRLSFPVEAIVDMIIPTTGDIRPSFRLGVNLGIDLFP